MSYNVQLVRTKGSKLINTGNFIEEGCSQYEDGTSYTELGVTYNYIYLFSFEELDGLTVEEGLEKLESTIVLLKDDVDENYWEATEGNVRKTLMILAEFARFAIKYKIDARFTVI